MELEQQRIRICMKTAISPVIDILGTSVEIVDGILIIRSGPFLRFCVAAGEWISYSIDWGTDN